MNPREVARSLRLGKREGPPASPQGPQASSGLPAAPGAGGEFLLYPTCHQRAPVKVILVAGRLWLVCSECGVSIGEIAFVQRSPGPDLRIGLEATR